MKKLHLLPLLFLSVFVVSCGNDDDTTGTNHQGSQNANKNVVTDEAAVSRLEFPRLKGGRSIVIVYRTSDNKKYDNDRVNYAVEWDCDKKSQRWSCYQMHQGYTGSYSRVVDGYMNDPSLEDGDYWNTDYIYGSGYEHGHICPNADRKYSYMANYQTFYMTNMQPQYHKFNGYTNSGGDKGEGLWVRMENKIRDWTPSASSDTLYVCKGGTIDNESQISNPPCAIGRHRAINQHSGSQPEAHKVGKRIKLLPQRRISVEKPCGKPVAEIEKRCGTDEYERQLISPQTAVD